MSEIELIWPEGLLRPGRPPYLVFLDTNHWIGLARARLGRPGASRYQRLFDTLRDATEDGSVRLVLSSPIVEEILQITDPRQRTDVVDAVEELSAFNFLAGRADVYRHELQSSLDRLTGTKGRGFSPIQLVSGRFLHAFGRRGDLSIVDAKGRDVTSAIAPGVMAELERRAQRMLLEGPRDEDLPAMLEAGYVPIRQLRGLTENARIEQHFADNQLDAHWRKGRLEDVLAARELSLELIDELTQELLIRGIGLSDFAGGKQEIRRFMMSMPSTVATVKIKSHYHRDPRKQWTVNDLRDIDSMSLAIPYCDFVLTDAAVRNAALVKKLDQTMNTSIPRTPDDLARRLDLSQG